MAAGFKYATVAAADVPSTQTNFPVYVDLSRIGITTLAEAQSVRVYADSGKTTEWAREIVSATEMHVKVPSLTSTTSIYVDWDGIRADYAASDTYGRNAVWTVYGSVWHLESSAVDSASNSADGTATSVSYSTGNGKIGSGGGFTKAGSSRITTPTARNLSSAFTLSCWGKNTYASSEFNTFFGNATAATGGTTDSYLVQATSSSARLQYQIGGSASFGGGPLNTGAWFHVAATVTGGTTGAVYVNGVQVDTDTWGSTHGTALYPRIGALGSTNYFEGSIDEARYSPSALSTNWLLTEYNNQNNEATFWGTWTTVSTTNTTNFFYMT